MAEKQTKRKPTGAAAMGAGPGRPKGVPNKATTAFRETVQALLERNSENVAIWLDQVASGMPGKDPAPEKALDLLAKLAEYAAPKLSRTEVSGPEGGPVQVQESRRIIVDPKHGQ
jgi:hypothetical protein